MSDDLLDRLRRAAAARRDFDRLLGLAFERGYTNAQIASATGDKTDTIRMRRKRAGK